MPQPSINKIHLKITYLKSHSNFPGANELNQMGVDKPAWELSTECDQKLTRLYEAMKTNVNY